MADAEVGEAAAGAGGDPAASGAAGAPGAAGGGTVRDEHGRAAEGAAGPVPRPGSAGEHALQQWLGSTRRADRFYDEQVLDHLNPRMQEFVAEQEMFFLATADRHGECDNSFRAGPPGFLRVLDERTLLFPEYRGNGVHASLGNLQENPHVGLLLMDFLRARIGLHVNGSAEVHEDAEIRARHPDLPVDPVPGRRAVLWVRVTVEEAYIHCAKHIPHLQKVPRGGSRDWGTDDVKRKGGDFFGSARDARERGPVERPPREHAEPVRPAPVPDPPGQAPPPPAVPPVPTAPPTPVGAPGVPGGSAVPQEGAAVPPPPAAPPEPPVPPYAPATARAADGRHAASRRDATTERPAASGGHTAPGAGSSPHGVSAHRSGASGDAATAGPAPGPAAHGGHTASAQAGPARPTADGPSHGAGHGNGTGGPAAGGHTPGGRRIPAVPRRRFPVASRPDADGGERSADAAGAAHCASAVLAARAAMPEGEAAEAWRRQAEQALAEAERRIGGGAAEPFQGWFS